MVGVARSWLFLLPAVAFFAPLADLPSSVAGTASPFSVLDHNAPTHLLGLPTAFVGLANFRRRSPTAALAGILRAFIFTLVFVPGMN